MNTSRLWALGGLILAFAVLAGGYFLGAAPALARADVAATSTAAVEAQNLLQAQVLATLREQDKTLGESRDELEDLQNAIPPEARLSAFVTEVSDLAAATGVAVSSITTTDAVLFAVTTSAEATGGATDDTAAEGAETDGAAPAADPDGAGPSTATVEPATETGMIAVPISVTVDGSYEAIFDLMDALRLGTRLYLIYDFAVTPVTDGGGTGYQASIVGIVYVLPGTEVASDEETAG